MMCTTVLQGGICHRTSTQKWEQDEGEEEERLHAKQYAAASEHYNFDMFWWFIISDRQCIILFTNRP